MKQISFRLRPGQLLKEEIERIARERRIGAGVLLSLVGGVRTAVLRMAGATPDAQIVRTIAGPLEIVSGTGTIAADGCHIHVSLSDKDGAVIGGHLKDGCVVDTTAEVVFGIFDDVVYRRIHDEATGFPEFHVTS
ncbi:DNA-binding protein [Patescibacteria group bacterium]|nr:MAG: DNA-binding protein [Patescibacteria group bacterium]